jgi:hypothetical protein
VSIRVKLTNFLSLYQTSASKDRDVDTICRRLTYHCICAHSQALMGYAERAITSLQLSQSSGQQVPMYAGSCCLQADPGMLQSVSAQCSDASGRALCVASTAIRELWSMLEQASAAAPTGWVVDSVCPGCRGWANGATALVLPPCLGLLQLCAISSSRTISCWQALL